MRFRYAMEMYKRISTSLIIAIITLSPLPSLAAETTKEKTVANSAEANFLTNNGCEDVSVGVSVTEKDYKQPPSDTSRELSVFGSFVDNCEFGNSTSFFGTSTVTATEFTQYGTDSARLVKTFYVGGNEIQISLVWTGVGVVGGEDSKIKEKTDDTKVTKTTKVESRNAEISGEFVINGLNRISGNSLVNAELDVVKMKTKTTTK
jgi:hypothetical protein